MNDIVAKELKSKSILVVGIDCRDIKPTNRSKMNKNGTNSRLKSDAIKPALTGSNPYDQLEKVDFFILEIHER